MLVLLFVFLLWTLSIPLFLPADEVIEKLHHREFFQRIGEYSKKRLRRTTSGEVIPVPEVSWREEATGVLAGVLSTVESERIATTNPVHSDALPLFFSRVVRYGNEGVGRGRGGG